MYTKTIVAGLSLLLIACETNSGTHPIAKTVAGIKSETSNPFARIEAIPVPAGFQRVKTEPGSFGAYLQKVSLKKDKTVYLFNGNRKNNQSAQFAVLDISTGDKDLQQCADAVMRLRTEYLFATQQFSRIAFTDNEGKVYQFTTPYTREHLQRYLPTVFGMCGSASLAKQLKRSSLQQMAIGDVLIRGGFPGHAAIVMDMATNGARETIYLLAQSYMPAQDIHVLVNDNQREQSPWYQLTDDEKIYTPEYVFGKNELRTW